MKVLEEPTAVQLQRAVYNRNLGGKLNQEDGFDLSAGTAFAVLGTVVNDLVVPANVPTIEAAIEALPQVTTAVPLCWGQQPTPESADDDAVLHVTARLIQTVATGGGGGFSQVGKMCRQQILPVGKKWVVWGLKVPVALDQSEIAALEAAVVSVAGVAVAKHLLDGAVDEEATAGSTLKVSCHIRVDPKPAEVPE